MLRYKYCVLINNLLHWWKHKVSPPIRWMVYLFAAMFSLSLMFAPEVRSKDYAQTDFTYHSSAKLYFHNVRSYYYYRDEEEKAGFYRYELKKQRMIDSLLPFGLFLLDNWRSSEVYIWLNPDSTITHIKIDSTTFSTQTLNREKMHLMAASIYQALLNDQSIFAKTQEGPYVEILTDRKEQKALETILFDYFRWLDIH